MNISFLDSKWRWSKSLNKNIGLRCGRTYTSIICFNFNFFLIVMVSVSHNCPCYKQQWKIGFSFDLFMPWDIDWATLLFINQILETQIDLLTFVSFLRHHLLTDSTNCSYCSVLKISMIGYIFQITNTI